MQYFERGLSEVSQNLETLVFLPLTRLVKPDAKRTLPLALMKCVKEPFFAAAISRLFLIVFRYTQPTLIKESIKYVVEYPAGAQSSDGYWLVVSAIGIYFGLAVSTFAAFHRQTLTCNFSYQQPCTNTA